MAKIDRHLHQTQVSASFISPTSRVRSLGQAIGVVFKEEAEKNSLQGADGSLK